MKKILLSKGKFAKVDDEDFDKLNELKWHVGSREKEKYTYYAISKHTLRMSRFVLEINGIKDFCHVTHIDGDGLNNQKKNLALWDKKQNMLNSQKRYNNKKGVTLHTQKVKLKSGKVNIHKSWRSRITIDGKLINLGTFKYKKDAVKARKEYFKEHCKKMYFERGIK